MTKPSWYTSVTLIIGFSLWLTISPRLHLSPSSQPATWICLSLLDPPTHFVPDLYTVHNPGVLHLKHGSGIRSFTWSRFVCGGLSDLIHGGLYVRLVPWLPDSVLAFDTMKPSSISSVRTQHALLLLVSLPVWNVSWRVVESLNEVRKITTERNFLSTSVLLHAYL